MRAFFVCLLPECPQINLKQNSPTVIRFDSIIAELNGVSIESFCLFSLTSAKVFLTSDTVISGIADVMTRLDIYLKTTKANAPEG